MIMHQAVLPPTRKPPKDASVMDLLKCGRYVDKLASGFYVYLPLGKMIINKIEQDIREATCGYGFLEVSTPILQDRGLLEESGRLEQYGDSIYNFSQDKKSYVINPTAEELMARIGFDSRDSQSLSFFQIGERVKNESRPAFGLVCTKSFILADFYTVCHSEVQARYEFLRVSMLVNNILRKIGVDFHSAFYAEKTAISYWQQSDKEKQCTVYACSNHHNWRSGELFQCPDCGRGVHAVQAIELADTSIQKNGEAFLAMAKINISRLLYVLAKNYQNDAGFRWPKHLAPYQIEIVSNVERRFESVKFYHELKNLAPQVLLDVRDQSLGRKLIDADLFGAPVRLVFGNQTYSGRIEVWDYEAQEKMELSNTGAIEWLKRTRV